MAQRIAILDRSQDGWSAGRSYTEMLVRSLRGVAPSGVELHVLTGSADGYWDGLADRVVVLPGRSLLERGLRELGIRVSDPAERYCRRNGVRALIPIMQCAAERTPFRRVAWIPDFQHRHLPHYFSDDENASRDRVFSRNAKVADLVMLSSAAAAADFRAFAPEYANKAAVAAFPSLFAFCPPPSMVGDGVKKYRLPEKFLLVANQYWSHKNHRVVVHALEILAGRGLYIPAVFTGMPSDNRSPVNQSVSELMQAIATAGLAGQVAPLGLVPHGDLVDLLRSAAVVVQPSRFEGWSTTVEDAKALGRPVICSDIPVHREQAPDALGFFGCDDPGQLADLLADVWGKLSAGPDPGAEKLALERERMFARQHGEQVLCMCLGEEDAAG
ncbi:MAG: glycosyltransferase [Nitrospirota bacterium]|nr:glycosyltransferase [Nitrospirota bacterium]